MIKKRSLSIRGHATSITLEDEFWYWLKKIALEKDMTVPKLIAQIDEDRFKDNTSDVNGLSSTLRVYILRHLEGIITEADQGL